METERAVIRVSTASRVPLFVKALRKQRCLPRVYTVGAEIDMFRKFSSIFSRIAAALENHAVHHPTHFPAVSSAKDVQEREPGDEFPRSDEAIEIRDDRQPR